MKIPKCMSTQHPDNVTTPFFAENKEMTGDDEIQEAYYAFSHLGCDEQMWDCEGKEVDNFVVKKLLTRYHNFFLENKLGKEVFLTLRVPNPEIEKAEAKILLETLESIPRSFDAAELFYHQEISPIFEVILPMASSSDSITRIHDYYESFIIGKQYKSIREGDLTVAEWIGKFKPEEINVIPLFEDLESMLNAHTTTKTYLNSIQKNKQRIFLARSDPALNYGLVSAVLLNKIALQNLYNMDADIYPIIGVGSAPFRGNLKPSTIERILSEYPSVYTFTIQSAFKYDNPPENIISAIKKLKEHVPTKPTELEKERCLEIIEKCRQEYKRQIINLVPTINQIAEQIPRRRKRKLHIGLFGYSRDVEGISLPRAIKFTAALYSIGIPPEVLGLNALAKEDIEFIKTVYLNFEDDLRDALQYSGSKVFKYLPPSLFNTLPEQHQGHLELTDHIVDAIKDKKDIKEYILRAAQIRGFLG